MHMKQEIGTVHKIPQAKWGCNLKQNIQETGCQRVRFKYSNYIERIVVIRVGEVGRLSNEVEVVIIKNTPQTETNTNTNTTNNNEKNTPQRTGYR